MAEDRLIELLLQGLESIGSTLQWWLGISIGVAALGHLVVKKLNSGMLILICMLYIGFTYSTVAVLARMRTITDGLAADLANLSTSGLVSTASQNLVQYDAGPGLHLSDQVFGVTFIGTFLGCLIFLVWSFVLARTRPGA